MVPPRTSPTQAVPLAESKMHKDRGGRCWKPRQRQSAGDTRGGNAATAVLMGWVCSAQPRVGAEHGHPSLDSSAGSHWGEIPTWDRMVTPVSCLCHAQR